MRDEARIVWYDAGDPAWVDGSLAGSIQDAEFFGEEGQGESGGSTATVNISAFGAGVAEESVAGGSTAGIGITAFGDGSAEEQASGGSSAGLLVQAFGDGEGQESAGGGALAAVAFGAFGAGDAEEFASGGSIALFSVSASGAGGAGNDGDGVLGGSSGFGGRVVLYPPRDRRTKYFVEEPEAKEPAKPPSLDLSIIRSLLDKIRSTGPISGDTAQTLKASEQRLAEALRKVESLRLRKTREALLAAREAAESARIAEISAHIALSAAIEEQIADDEDALLLMSTVLVM